jgi:hypothetical protein
LLYRKDDCQNQIIQIKIIPHKIALNLKRTHLKMMRESIKLRIKRRKELKLRKKEFL